MVKINSNSNSFDNILDIYIKNTFLGKKPIILCIGTDKATGDTLAPLIGTILTKELNISTYVYGTLEQIVNAKNIKYVYDRIKQIHPYDKVLCIDASLGNLADIGFVKFSTSGLLPASACKKNLGEYGDFSIVGIVDEVSANKFNIFKTRMKTVYEMSKKISYALKKAIG